MVKLPNGGFFSGNNVVAGVQKRKIQREIAMLQLVSGCAYKTLPCPLYAASWKLF